MEILALIGATTIFVICGVGIAYWFGEASITFTNEVTGKQKTYSRRDK